MGRNEKGVKALRAITFIGILILIMLFTNRTNKHDNHDMNMEFSSQENKTKALESLKEVLNKDHNEPVIEPVFTQSSLSEETLDKIIGVSWKENSPVKLEELSYINVTYWGFDDVEHVGEMIVHEKLAQEVVDIFRELYVAKFPIEKMNLIDEYDANDDLSMADNNTSAFCSREITGKKGVFSEHSYGIAIDINPIQNPYIKGETILPVEGTSYLDRENTRKGMIIKGDQCYNAFKSRGWTWGGEWNTLKDYQHFEKKINFD